MGGCPPPLAEDADDDESVEKIEELKPSASQVLGDSLKDSFVEPGGETPLQEYVQTDSGVASYMTPKVGGPFGIKSVGGSRKRPQRTKVLLMKLLHLT